ncbi:hypothetical protein [Agromyces humi]|uniref:hypothetical protein n=1 Tax=Agromyces humi TaxID=1766800 RepID=UPI00135A0B6F|nr:hypothetical protein [Agromyces humi]
MTQNPTDKTGLNVHLTGNAWHIVTEYVRENYDAPEDEADTVTNRLEQTIENLNGEEIAAMLLSVAKRAFKAGFEQTGANLID